MAGQTQRRCNSCSRSSPLLIMPSSPTEISTFGMQSPHSRHRNQRTMPQGVRLPGYPWYVADDDRCASASKFASAGSMPVVPTVSGDTLPGSDAPSPTDPLECRPRAKSETHTGHEMETPKSARVRCPVCLTALESQEDATATYARCACGATFHRLTGCRVVIWCPRRRRD